MMPGVFCEAAGAHTEGSMNVHVHTAEGVATICGDVIYDINDQIVEPLRQNNDGEPQTTGNHGTTKRAEKAAIKKVLANARFILPVHDRPARVEGGTVVARMQDFRARPDRPDAAQAQLVPGLSDNEGITRMTHATLRPEFEDLIDPYAPVGQVGTGFTFTEGPIWHPTDQYLLFSDMPADVRRRWDAGRGVAEVRRPSNKCNGMTYDADLNLIVCEHATSSLVRERPDGRREVLATHFEGQELNSPNDVCVRSDGSIYFSDPYYGRMPAFGVERPRALGFQGVYRIPPGGGGPQLLVDRLLFDQPNGLCFSPDEKLLYVNDTVQTPIRVFDVAADGSLSNGRIFASGIRSSLEEGVPDGMKCDQRGNVWVTAPGGVWVYAPSGDLIGKVRAPERVANLAWGGPDFRTLFLTATHSVYRIETKVGPRREPYMSAQARGGATVSSAAETRPAAASPLTLAKDLTLDPGAARSSFRTCRTTSSAKAAPSPHQGRRRTRARRTWSRTHAASPKPRAPEASL